MTQQAQEFGSRPDPGSIVGQSFACSVTSYGAKGDGTTDDTAAIQAAINAVPQAGGTVLFPIGIYKLTSTLTISVANRPIELVGAGSGEQVHGTPAGGGSVLRWAGASSSPVIDVTVNSTTCMIRDMTIDNSIAGANAASHGIRAKDAHHLLIRNVLMNPEVGKEFATAGIELGTAGHDVGKVHIEDCYLNNCVIGLLVRQCIVCEVRGTTIYQCGTCAQVGTATETVFCISFSGCTFEARTGQTGARIVRGEAVTFVGCQFDAWDATHYGAEILSTAALADCVSFIGCRFSGLLAAGATSAIKVDYASATVLAQGCYFEGFATSGIKNANNKWLHIIGCHSNDAAIPLVDSLTTGSVRQIACDITGTMQEDQLGTNGLRVPSYAAIGGGTPPTSGAIRFSKPSEVPLLLTFNKNDGTAYVAIITTDTDNYINFGSTSNLGGMRFYSPGPMQICVDALWFRSSASATRAILDTSSVYNTWNQSSGTSLSFQYNSTTRFKFDSTGIGFYTATPVAQQLLATGAGHTVDDVITALQNLGLVKQS